MKKLSLIVCAVAMLGVCFTSCKKDDKNIDNIVENGFYVVGDAANLPDLNVKGQFGPGYNEAAENALRSGMYEKYIVLEAGKKFHFAKKQGELIVKYGATLKNDSLPTDFTPVFGYKGSLAENVEMQVEKTALYHIILDFDDDGALKNVGGAQIVIAEVKWGVSGGMNSWGWTEGQATEIKAGTESITWTWKDQELAAAGEFKFKNSSAWKINLDDAELVKANANLGLDCLQGGKNIAVEEAGKYDITLTFTLSKGEVAKSYKYELKLTEKSELPSTMYMIGNDFGNWNWEDAGVVELAPVHSHPGMFWCIRHLTTASQFKWCAQKAWNGDFKALGTNEGFITPDNAQVEADGIYMILIDLKGDKISIYPAEVYGMGDCFGGWDGGKAENKFAVDGAKLVSPALPAAGNVRMYTAVKAEGVDWWQAEFNVFDGKIVCRGDGGDQEAVPAQAGQKVTLDFNAGTGAIQ